MDEREGRGLKNRQKAQDAFDRAAKKAQQRKEERRKVDEEIKKHRHEPEHRPRGPMEGIAQASKKATQAKAAKSRAEKETGQQQPSEFEKDKEDGVKKLENKFNSRGKDGGRER